MPKEYNNNVVIGETYVATGAVSCRNSIFRDCVTDEFNGGAISHSILDSSLAFTATVFERCKTILDEHTGGAVYIRQSELTLSSTNFVKCYSYDNGGGLSQGRVGGGYSKFTRVDLCLFDQNGGSTCYQDASYYIYAHEITITGLNSSHNVAPSASCGTLRGQKEGTSPIHFSRSTIINGQKQSLYVAHGKFVAEYFNFVRCTNPALFIESGVVFDHELRNCVFIAGSGISIGGTLELICCQFELPLSTHGEVTAQSILIGHLVKTHNFEKLKSTDKCVFRTGYFSRHLARRSKIVGLSTFLTFGV